MQGEAITADQGGKQSAASSYRQILKSSALLGGASAANIVIGLVRTKVMAVLLGPAGYGLIAAYTAIAELARSVAEMGLHNSAVRQIAESAGTGDAERIARTVRVLRTMAVVLGLLGGAALILLSGPIAEFTFGHGEHRWDIALLSIAVFVHLITAGQTALLQGLRRLGELARISVLGAGLGLAVSIPIVYVGGQSAVAWMMVAVSVAALVVSWWYARKVDVVPVRLRFAEMTSEAKVMLQLGMAFMLSALLMMGASYAVRIMVLRHGGIEDAGFYHAGWSIAGLYVGFILQAMGTDFYPRLVGMADDNAASIRLVNEQAHVSLLLAGPGIVLTLAAAPLIVSLLYTPEFIEAVGVLQWVCLGMALRVITWPMGFIIVARNQRTMFIFIEVAWTVVNLGLSWLLIDRIGLVGAGVAFFLSYVFHGLALYPMVRSLIGFRWSAPTLSAASTFIAAIAVVFLMNQYLPTVPAVALGLLVCAGLSVVSLRSLARMTGTAHVPRSVQRLLGRLGMGRTEGGPRS